MDGKGFGSNDWGKGHGNGDSDHFKGKADGSKGQLHGKGSGAGVPSAQPAPRKPQSERQMVGERLYAILQRMVPTTTMAQKITGMLLELPMDELQMLVDQSSTR